MRVGRRRVHEREDEKQRESDQQHVAGPRPESPARIVTAAGRAGRPASSRGLVRADGTLKGAGCGPIGDHTTMVALVI
jgi:hypothetical protein